MPNSDINLNEREQLRYLLGNAPSWMLHYGISAVALFVVVLLTMAHFIQYPDIAEAKIILTTSNPPLHLMVKSGGKVSHLLVQNQQNVNKGQLLTVLENTANYQDVLTLEKSLNEAELSHFRVQNSLNLGSLQGIYSTFTQNSKDYTYFFTQSGIGTKVRNIRKQIKHLQAMNVNLQRQKSIFQNEILINSREVERQRKLYTQGALSLADLEKTSVNHLAQKRQAEANEANFISNEMQIKQLESQISDLRQNHNDNNNNKTLTLSEDLQKLKAAIEEWKATYLVIAPIDGQVSFSKIWSPQQNITAGDEVCSVVPIKNNENTIIGKAILPVANANKVKIGMKTFVRLDAMPYQQFGTVEGAVSNISLIPEKEDYLLEITFSQPLTSSYGKNIDFRQEMQGQARIITESRSVLNRIFDRWNDLLKNR
jgi:multidrug resistance efflux pump